MRASATADQRAEQMAALYRLHDEFRALSQRITLKKRLRARALNAALLDLRARGLITDQEVNQIMEREDRSNDEF